MDEDTWIMTTLDSIVLGIETALLSPLTSSCSYPLQCLLFQKLINTTSASATGKKRENERVDLSIHCNKYEQ